ncbi:unnamed protein product [Amoebophrya sp. A25]|nr:unnamed protein product [Amoebophrya sp. A25]|eukprot:GSA25T00000061001.1
MRFFSGGDSSSPREDPPGERAQPRPEEQHREHSAQVSLQLVQQQLKDVERELGFAEDADSLEALLAADSTSSVQQHLQTGSTRSSSASQMLEGINVAVLGTEQRVVVERVDVGKIASEGRRQKIEELADFIQSAAREEDWQEQEPGIYFSASSLRQRALELLLERETLLQTETALVAQLTNAAEPQTSSLAAFTESASLQHPAGVAQAATFVPKPPRTAMGADEVPQQVVEAQPAPVAQFIVDIGEGIALGGGDSRDRKLGDSGLEPIEAAVKGPPHSQAKMLEELAVAVEETQEEATAKLEALQESLLQDYKTRVAMKGTATTTPPNGTPHEGAHSGRRAPDSSSQQGYGDVNGSYINHARQSLHLSLDSPPGASMTSPIAGADILTASAQAPPSAGGTPASSNASFGGANRLRVQRADRVLEICALARQWQETKQHLEAVGQQLQTWDEGEEEGDDDSTPLPVEELPGDHYLRRSDNLDLSTNTLKPFRVVIFQASPEKGGAGVVETLPLGSTGAEGGHTSRRSHLLQAPTARSLQKTPAARGTAQTAAASKSNTSTLQQVEMNQPGSGDGSSKVDASADAEHGKIKCESSSSSALHNTPQQHDPTNLQAEEPSLGRIQRKYSPQAEGSAVDYEPHNDVVSNYTSDGTSKCGGGKRRRAPRKGQRGVGSQERPLHDGSPSDAASHYTHTDIGADQVAEARHLIIGGAQQVQEIVAKGAELREHLLSDLQEALQEDGMNSEEKSELVAATQQRLEDLEGFTKGVEKCFGGTLEVALAVLKPGTLAAPELPELEEIKEDESLSPQQDADAGSNRADRGTSKGGAGNAASSASASPDAVVLEFGSDPRRVQETPSMPKQQEQTLFRASSTVVPFMPLLSRRLRRHQVPSVIRTRLRLSSARGGAASEADPKRDDAWSIASSSGAQSAPPGYDSLRQKMIIASEQDPLVVLRSAEQTASAEMVTLEADEWQRTEQGRGIWENLTKLLTEEGAAIAREEREAQLEQIATAASKQGVAVPDENQDNASGLSVQGHGDATAPPSASALLDFKVVGGPRPTGGASETLVASTNHLSHARPVALNVGRLASQVQSRRSGLLAALFRRGVYEKSVEQTAAMEQEEFARKVADDLRLLLSPDLCLQGWQLWQDDRQCLAVFVKFLNKLWPAEKGKQASTENKMTSPASSHLQPLSRGCFRRRGRAADEAESSLDEMEKGNNSAEKTGNELGGESEVHQRRCRCDNWCGCSEGSTCWRPFSCGRRCRSRRSGKEILSAATDNAKTVTKPEKILDCRALYLEVLFLPRQQRWQALSSQLSSFRTVAGAFLFSVMFAMRFASEFEFASSDEFLSNWSAFQDTLARFAEVWAWLIAVLLLFVQTLCFAVEQQCARLKDTPSEVLDSTMQQHTEHTNENSNPSKTTATAPGAATNTLPHSTHSSKGTTPAANTSPGAFRGTTFSSQQVSFPHASAAFDYKAFHSVVTQASSARQMFDTAATMLFWFFVMNIFSSVKNWRLAVCIGIGFLSLWGWLEVTRFGLSFDTSPLQALHSEPWKRLNAFGQCCKVWKFASGSKGSKRTVELTQKEVRTLIARLQNCDDTRILLKRFCPGVLAGEGAQSTYQNMSK